MQLHRVLSSAPLLALLVTPALAQSTTPPPVAPAATDPAMTTAPLSPTDESALARGNVSDWSWLVAPYFWAADIDGSVTKPLVGEVDFSVSFDDIFDNLGSAGLVFFEVKRDQFSLLGDFIYLGIEADGTTSIGAEVEAEIDTTIAELAGLYRLSPTSPYELGAGLRYALMESEFELASISRESSMETFDGILAGRASWHIANHMSLTLYGDIGAGNSDLTWQASGTLGYHFTGWGLALGYRGLGYEFEDGREEADLTLSGLIFGAEFRF